MPSRPSTHARIREAQRIGEEVDEEVRAGKLPKHRAREIKIRRVVERCLVVREIAKRYLFNYRGYVCDEKMAKKFTFEQLTMFEEG